MMGYTFEHVSAMTDGQLAKIFGAIKVDQQLSRTLWYDGAPTHVLAWIKLARSWWFARVIGADDTTVGVFWLNGYQGRTAQIHFAVFDGFRGEAVQMGRATLQWLGELNWLHSVYGVTPVTHRHVFPLLESLGFKILGRIPGACWVERKQKHVAGVISVYDLGRHRHENL